MPRAAIALLLLALLALLCAALQPRVPWARETFDYVVVLDITQSMNTQDVELGGRPVTRLAYARASVRDALDRLPCGSRVGWGAFTEYRSLLLLSPVEVCTNHPDLVAALEQIDGRSSWAGASEVSKGLFSALRFAAELPDPPAVVFITDGHEAPPLHPAHRPAYQGEPGKLRGLVAGVGGDMPARIPKLDPEGRSLGYWEADEVAQTDPYSGGRAASVAGEAMVDESGRPEAPAGSRRNEHLSFLHEPHLQRLAGETGLLYARLESVDALARAMTQPALARRTPVATDIHPLIGGIGLVLLAAGWLAPLSRRT